MEAIPELQAAKRISFTPATIAACLRLKVWNPDVNAMVDLKGLV
jgi:omega-6 fatty acid desaturase (delta-12 desaturase)